MNENGSYLWVYKTDLSKPLDIDKLDDEENMKSDLTKYVPNQTIKLATDSFFSDNHVNEAVRRILSYAASECIIEYSKPGKRDPQPFFITFDCEEIQMRTGCQIVISEKEWTALEYLTTHSDIHRIVGYELSQLVFKYLEEKLLVTKQSEKK